MDIVGTKSVIEYALKWAVDEEECPLLIDCTIYHYGGHSACPAPAQQNSTGPKCSAYTQLRTAICDLYALKNGNPLPKKRRKRCSIFRSAVGAD
ncbi:hypothetical protein CPB84DRAFT_1781795 [Gymnopilus junonius]|uniref:Uncharacterized protein n=1 Tax=Gymnopilus junonius TaxID=109634 RepID=A0A9P5TM08_GYMJU|nr:hypothetical protein CPB84DRAFT_1781795 [Gymnopilus junonius]